MKISMISPVDLTHRDKEKIAVRKRSKITGVVLDYLEVAGGEAALFADANPHAMTTIRKKRKKA